MRVTSLVLLSISLVACGASNSSSASSSGESEAPRASSGGTSSLPSPDIDGPEAQRLVAEGAFLLDVTPAPYAEQSFIEGRVNIPLPELEARMAEVPRDRPVIVYCAGGGGSPVAARTLRDAGYPNVRLLGAMANWSAPADGSSATAP